jgi:ribosomal protein L6P/L9E
VLFRNIFYSFAQVFFKKIKFKGKGYYIYKNYRNTIAMQFGYSHRLRVYSYFLSIQFITKTAFLLFGINKNDILKAGFQIFYKRPINIFTGKGIRFNRQIVYKKIGKVSSYR